MGNVRQYGRPRAEFDPAKVMRLHKKGLSDEEIAKELSVCHATATKWRKALGLKSNKPLPKEGEISQLAKDARDARRAGMNYGMWKAQQFDAVKTSRNAWQMRFKKTKEN